MLALQRLTGEYHGHALGTVQSRFSRWPAYRQGRSKLSLPATYSNKTYWPNASRLWDVTRISACCSSPFSEAKKRPLFRVAFFDVWLREPDLNRRPSGYEPDELPDCSIPRLCVGILQSIAGLSIANSEKTLFLQVLSSPNVRQTVVWPIRGGAMRRYFSIY